MNTLRSLLTGICLACACLIAGCALPDLREYDDDVAYWGSDDGCCWWSKRLTAEEAKAEDSYRAVYYDEDGRRYRTEIYIAGKFFFRWDEELDGSGKTTRLEMTRADGRSEVFRYDYDEAGEVRGIGHVRLDGTSKVFRYDEDEKRTSY